MKLEIERKFLVKNEDWRKLPAKTSEIRQGYFSRAADFVLRVRIIDGRGLLTLKGRPQGPLKLTRQEFEYEIPLEDTEAMLTTFCGQRIIEKRRYYLDAGKGLVWEIDEYFGKCQGLVTAEIELPTIDTPFEAPDWLGRDVSTNPLYGNKALAEIGLPADYLQTT